MKKILSVLLSFILLIVFLSGCGEESKPDSENDSSTPPVNIESKSPTGTPSLEELHSIVESDTDDPLGYYASVLAFLEGNTEELSRHSSNNLEDGLEASCYDDIATVQINSYEIIENEDGALDFYFTVSDSGSSDFEVGEYHYKVWDLWTPVTQYSSSEKYGDLIELIDWAAGHGCISWENGKSTSDFHDSYTFDFGVSRSVAYARTIYKEKGNELPTFDFDEAVYKMYGIEDFSSTSQYLICENGKWVETQYIGPVNVVSTILDIREKDDYIEVDVQYYADMLRLVPSHMTTIYVKNTDDPIYKYYFEKSIIVKTSDYDPLWWSI